MDLNLTLYEHARPTTRILRLNQVTEAIGLSRASIYRLMKLNLFPKSIKIGISAVGWLQSEVEMWITERQVLGMTF